MLPWTHDVRCACSELEKKSMFGSRRFLFSFIQTSHPGIPGWQRRRGLSMAQFVDPEWVLRIQSSPSFLAITAGFFFGTLIFVKTPSVRLLPVSSRDLSRFGGCDRHALVLRAGSPAARRLRILGMRCLHARGCRRVRLIAAVPGWGRRQRADRHRHCSRSSCSRSCTTSH